MLLEWEEQELWNLRDQALRLCTNKKVEKEVCVFESLEVKPECEECGKNEFVETPDYTNYEKVCTHCGCVSFGDLYYQTQFRSVRQQGRTIYDPLERFRYWIQLAEGNGKLPKPLLKSIENIQSNTELKQFLFMKQNRKYRKYYASILKMWEEDLVLPLSNCEKESLELNFNHLLRTHKFSRERNAVTGRKKSMPHYTFLIEIFLRKIGRDDLASNFLPMKCSKIRKEYEQKILESFS
jgi:hypothetical protein